MIVCHCHGKTDRDIRRAIREGARREDDVVTSCAAGRSCGGCVEVIRDLIRTEGAAPTTVAAAARKDP